MIQLQATIHGHRLYTEEQEQADTIDRYFNEQAAKWKKLMDDRANDEVDAFCYRAQKEREVAPILGRLIIHRDLGPHISALLLGLLVGFAAGMLSWWGIT